MSNDEEKQEKRGFKVEDRRRFSESGETRPAAPDSHQTGAGAASDAPPTADTSAPRSVEAPPMDLNFSTFVISLSTQALMHLGEIVNPISGKIDADVPAAKQMIDMLGMIREKTSGNLNANEARLMQDILFDLRMKYVEAVKKR